MFTSHCFASYTEAASLKICAHRVVHTAVDLITAQRHNSKTGRWEKKVERRGMNNEGWLYSAHSVFTESEEELWCAQRYGNTPTPLPGRLTRMFLCSLRTSRVYSFWNVRLTEKSAPLANASKKRRSEKAGVVKSIYGGHSDIFIRPSLTFLSLTYIAPDVFHTDGPRVTININTVDIFISFSLCSAPLCLDSCPLWWRVLRRQIFFFSVFPLSPSILHRHFQHLHLPRSNKSSWDKRGY